MTIAIQLFFYLHFISHYLVIVHTYYLIAENTLLNVSSPFIKHLLSLFYSHTHLISISVNIKTDI